MASTTKTKQKTRRRILKQPLSEAPEFIKELTHLFAENTLITPSSALLEFFKQFKHIPPKWTCNTIKKNLTESGVLVYSRKKPMGFSLNTEQLNRFLDGKAPVLERKSIPAKTSTIKRPRPSSRTTGKPKTHISSNSRTVSSKPHKTPPKTQSTRDILNKIPTFPAYLMKRLSSKTRKVLHLGALELNAIKPLSKVEKSIDLLTSAKIFFDHTYDDEKRVMDALDIRIRYLSERANGFRNRETDYAFNRIFNPMVNNGKFSKVLRQWEKENIDLQDCAQRCLKKMGGKAKKIPHISEYALRRKIQTALHEKYPKRK
ncbi:MAG: hypothetical protein ACTSWW_02635 [Promethearchaeota archaeon]